jgi:hypothetical protein
MIIGGRLINRNEKDREDIMEKHNDSIYTEQWLEPNLPSIRISPKRNKGRSNLPNVIGASSRNTSSQGQRNGLNVENSIIEDQRSKVSSRL